MIVIIGLDLGTHKIGASSTWVDESHGPDFTNIQHSLGPPKSTLSTRLVELSRFVDETVGSFVARDYKCIVGAESVMTKGAFNLALMGETHGVVRCTLKEMFDMELMEVPLSTCRGTFLGHYKKELVEQYGGIKPYTRAIVSGFFPGIGPDAADAFVVANHLCCAKGFGYYTIRDRPHPPVPVGRCKATTKASEGKKIRARRKG